MSEIRDQVVDAAVTALNTGRPGGIPAAEREMLDDLPAGTDLAIAVGEFIEKREVLGGARGPMVHCTLVLEVDCWARGTTAVPAGKAVSPLLGWIDQALGGSRLGGLIDRAVGVELQWDRERRESRSVLVKVFVSCKYTTKINDASVPA